MFLSPGAAQACATLRARAFPIWPHVAHVFASLHLSQKNNLSGTLHGETCLSIYYLELLWSYSNMCRHNTGVTWATQQTPVSRSLQEQPERRVSPTNVLDLQNDFSGQDCLHGFRAWAWVGRMVKHNVGGTNRITYFATRTLSSPFGCFEYWVNRSTTMEASNSTVYRRDIRCSNHDVEKPLAITERRLIYRLL